MKYGFIRAGAASPEIKVANSTFNADKIIEVIRQTQGTGCDILVFPELCVTGYTCGDLFLHSMLIYSAERDTLRIAQQTKDLNTIFIVGLPVYKGAELYNCAAVLYDGKIYGIVPKRNIPNYGDVNESRYFTPYQDSEVMDTVRFGGQDIPFGNLVFDCSQALMGFYFSAEIGKDLWAADSSPALIVCNPAADAEIAGRREYRKTRISADTGKNVCAYVYSGAGTWESTTDGVFSGQKLICENTHLLAESQLFRDTELVLADIDTQVLIKDRRTSNLYRVGMRNIHTIEIPFQYKLHTNCLRRYEKTPFVPSDENIRSIRCADILDMQAYALRKRLLHTHTKSVVIGLSGGLDSTLALLACARAFDIAGIERKQISCITMPCFGTTDRTYQNACRLCSEIGATLTEIRIEQSVLQHFADIGQDPANHDVTFENAQARERTQILMDYANRTGALVIGTGDLSELALGWATYNGDHMSMYGINASIPKTLVRYLVQYCADISSGALQTVLNDILDTPVSPELLPPEDGKISQKTEDIVGPYELHDFFLYYFQRYAFTPGKIFHIARIAFQGVYDDAVILKWLRKFYTRFFSQQFKRSCMPDGPKIGTVALSPRGDLKMPSDADPAVWLNEIDQI